MEQTNGSRHHLTPLNSQHGIDKEESLFQPSHTIAGEDLIYTGGYVHLSHSSVGPSHLMPLRATQRIHPRTLCKPPDGTLADGRYDVIHGLRRETCKPSPSTSPFPSCHGSCRVLSPLAIVAIKLCAFQAKAVHGAICCVMMWDIGLLILGMVRNITSCSSDILAVALLWVECRSTVRLHNCVFG